MNTYPSLFVSDIEFHPFAISCKGLVCCWNQVFRHDAVFSIGPDYESIAIRDCGQMSSHPIHWKTFRWSPIHSCSRRKDRPVISGNAISVSIGFVVVDMRVIRSHDGGFLDQQRIFFDFDRHRCRRQPAANPTINQKPHNEPVMSTITAADLVKEIRDVDLAVRDAVLQGDIDLKMKDLKLRIVSGSFCYLRVTLFTSISPACSRPKKRRKRAVTRLP
jgi:hypothetical protein